MHEAPQQRPFVETSNRAAQQTVVADSSERLLAASAEKNECEDNKTCWIHDKSETRSITCRNVYGAVLAAL